MDKKTLTFITVFTAVIAVALALYVLSGVLTKPSVPKVTPSTKNKPLIIPSKTPSFTFSPKEPENARILLTPAPSNALQQTQSQPAKPAQLKKVDITATKFSPDNVEVTTGDVITWTNTDTRAQKIIGKSWRSGTIQPGKAFSQEFDVAGTYQYYSEVDPGMVGTITVK